MSPHRPTPDTPAAAGDPICSGERRPLRADAARNRALLIEAGRAVFAQRGLDASLNDVARRAGVGIGTAYRHFANKQELASAIFDHIIDEVIAFTTDLAAAEDPWAGLVAFLERATEQQSHDRGLRDALAGAHDPEMVDRIATRMTGPINTLVTRARESGQLRDDVEATDLWLIVSMLCTVVDVSAARSPELWRRYLAMLLDGLRAGARGPLPVPAISESAMREAMAAHMNRA